jgi:L-lactate dehydrogenase complex protein LldG
VAGAQPTVTRSHHEARAGVLANVRRALRRTGPLDGSLAAALETRLGLRSVHVQPCVDADLTAAFVAKAQAVQVTVDRLDDAADLPGAVARYLQEQGITGPLLVNDEALLREHDWPASLPREHRAATRDDVVSLTVAQAGIAETGTLLLTSSATRPTSQNFLPDDHIVVLREALIVAHLEDAFKLLRTGAGLPRAVNLITGPSKTADVEQTIQYGAHGPRRLHVILICA